MKNMYRTKFLYISLSFLTILLFTACKEERGPRLIVSVINQGDLVPGAIVRASPGMNPQLQSGSDPTSVVDSTVAFRQALTDANGEVTFDFEFSLVLDIDVAQIVEEARLDTTGFDIMGNPIVVQTAIFDTLRGRTVVQLESLLQREEENTTSIVVEVN